MERIIKAMENKYLQPSLAMVEEVFARWDSPEEGKVVRKLVEEIRSKKYYIPELEFIMVDETDEVIGYAMFSRFHIEGKYEEDGRRGKVEMKGVVAICDLQILAEEASDPNCFFHLFWRK